MLNTPRCGSACKGPAAPTAFAIVKSCWTLLWADLCLDSTAEGREGHHSSLLDVFVAVIFHGTLMLTHARSRSGIPKALCFCEEINAVATSHVANNSDSIEIVIPQICTETII
jgi:hypothetical protein